MEIGMHFRTRTTLPAPDGTRYGPETRQDFGAAIYESLASIPSKKRP